MRPRTLMHRRTYCTIVHICTIVRICTLAHLRSMIHLCPPVHVCTLVALCTLAHHCNGSSPITERHRCAYLRPALRTTVLKRTMFDEIQALCAKMLPLQYCHLHCMEIFTTAPPLCHCHSHNTFTAGVPQPPQQQSPYKVPHFNYSP